MQHEPDAQGKRTRLPLLARLWRLGTRRLTTVAALHALVGVSCQAGELDERQEAYLRRQLDEQYPNGGQPSDDPSSGSTTTTQPTTTSQPEVNPTSSASEAEVTSVPTQSTPAPTPTSSAMESSAANTGGGQVPDCALQTFKTTCSGDVCHSGGAIQLAPNFDTNEDLFTMLTTSETGCSGAPSSRYVDVDNPENSYLLVKVRGEQPSGCGGAMPSDRSKISQAQIDCLEDWIGSL